MKKFIHIMLLLIVASSCSKSSSDGYEISFSPPISLEDNIFKALKDKYNLLIPNIDKYNSGSQYNVPNSDTIIVAFNSDTDIDVFYFTKKDKLISSFNAPHTKKDVKIGLVFRPKQHVSLDAISIAFIDKSSTTYNSNEIKSINVYKTKDSKLNELKSFKTDIDYHKWDNIIYKKSGEYVYHTTDNVLSFVDPLNLNEFKSYQYYYNWTYLDDDNFLIFNDANDIITIKPSKYKDYYITESAKIALNNGTVVKNWEDQIGIYLPRLSLKTGEIERRKNKIRLEGSVVIVEFEIYTKLWDGKNNLVEKTENKTYRFNINSGVKI